MVRETAAAAPPVDASNVTIDMVSSKSSMSSSSSQRNYDIFLTHDWGIDQLERDNHARVSRINASLKQRGFTTWFDEDRLQGNIRDELAKAISHSKLILVHVTQRYRDKVDSSNPLDNCYYEFNYAASSKARDIEVVVMEPRMRDTTNWGVRMRAELGSSLYIDMSGDDAVLWEKRMDELAERLRRKLRENF